MLNQKEYHQIIEKRLTEIKIPEFPSNLYDPIRYILNLGAKRLRPSLALMACNIFNDNIEQAINPALAIEVFHNFTLMHDDIMDNAALRRSQPTVHKKWNENIAILSGDAMMIKAYELLSLQEAENLARTLPVFNQTALRVCEGQQYDMDYEQKELVTQDDYLKMVELKTAVLIAASLMIGALTGGAGNEQAEILYEFGRNIGKAFQLQDDLIDVYGDQQITGKETGNDIVNNKKTILLVQALNLAEGTVREELMYWLNSTDFNKEQKIEAVKNIYNNLSIEQSTREMIRNFFDDAWRQINQLQVDKRALIPLKEFTRYLIHREK